MLGELLATTLAELLQWICGPIGAWVIRIVTLGRARPSSESILAWSLGLVMLVALVSGSVWAIVKLA